MEVVTFEAIQNPPIVFSKEFFRYLNSAIDGERIFLAHKNAIMPIILKNKLFFKIGYCSHPPLKGGCKLTEEEEVDFFCELGAFLKRSKLIDFIVAPIHIENFSHIPVDGVGHKIGIIRLSLKNKSEDEIFSSFKSMYRNLIRKALKEDVSVKFGMDCFDDFYNLYREKLVLENASYDSYEVVKNLAISLDKKGQMICAVAYYNKMPNAGVLNIQDGKNAYYLWAGTANNAHAGSLRLLHWEIIKIYLEKGIENYRMGAAREGDLLNEKHARLLAFKTGFGCEVDEGFHFTFISNKWKFKLYTILLNLKSFLKR